MKPHIAKVTVNIGVGEAGEKLKKAESVLAGVTKQKPIQTLSKTTNKDWGLRKFMPIGCKVTLRKKTAETFLIKALKIERIKSQTTHLTIKGIFHLEYRIILSSKDKKYDPNIGIFGMDICVTWKPGYRINVAELTNGKSTATSTHQRRNIHLLLKHLNVEVVE